MRILTGILAAAALLAMAPAQANLITNGSFEGGAHGSGFVTLGTGSNAIAGWTVTGGSVDWIHQNFWEASDGTFSLDLSGRGAGAIEAATSFATVVGESYLLSFDLAGNVDSGEVVKDLRVSVGGSTADFSFDTTGQTRANMGWLQQTLQFTATSVLTSLSFQSLEQNAWGPALDNVSVTALNAVPEPAGLALLGLGLAALGARRGLARRGA